ncbi:GATA-binding factor 2 [Castilleja foliolosa]|uniref:GATA-binding factor 2 n=1 Tax=Castilleja foliolosa TaxID=1961234 RepID=A0ABD3BGF5_9LAMI
MRRDLGIYKHASFFKILLFDFSTKLRIPKEFVKKYGEIMPEEAILETEARSKSWAVKIKPLDEHFCFMNGWPQFVKDNKLCDMDFLVFTLVSKSTFQVAIYGKDGVLRQPFSPDFNKKLSFTSVNDHHNRFFMVIPNDFAMETGIAMKNAINLQNEGGDKKWRVNIDSGRNGQRFLMSEGWSVFREENNLSIGATLRFEFDANSGNLILRKKTKINAAGFHGRPRSKRSRPSISSASFENPMSICGNVKREESLVGDINGGNTESGEVARRCTHCASEKTPQWRTGPLGPKTLCNACGVRYKSGRLVPEYMPAAASPTFVLTQHSNSHRKVLELRRQKEMLRQQQHEEAAYGRHFWVC